MPYATAMAVNPDTTARKLITMPHELVERVKAFRFQQQINTETEAIRRLIELGLDAVAQDGTKPKKAA